MRPQGKRATRADRPRENNREEERAHGLGERTDHHGETVQLSTPLGLDSVVGRYRNGHKYLESEESGESEGQQPGVTKRGQYSLQDTRWRDCAANA